AGLGGSRLFGGGACAAQQLPGIAARVGRESSRTIRCGNRVQAPWLAIFAGRAGPARNRIRGVYRTRRVVAVRTDLRKFALRRRRTGFSAVVRHATALGADGPWPAPRAPGGRGLESRGRTMAGIAAPSIAEPRGGFHRLASPAFERLGVECAPLPAPHRVRPPGRVA